MKPAELTLEIVAFVDAYQPGWVECHLVDAAGQLHVFVEKVPVVSDVELDESTEYPVRGAIRCLAAWPDDDAAPVLVDTLEPWGIESTEEVSRFVVDRALVLVREAERSS